MPGVSSTTVGLSSTPGGRDRFQRLQQLAGIVVDRAHAQAFEHLRESALHQVAVLEHVGDAGRHAQIVLEHVDLAVAVAHQIGAGDVAPDPPRRIDARALRAVERGRADDLFRDDLVLQDLLIVIDVVDELVERVDALLEAALDPLPLLGALTMRGIRSKGKMRSVPAESP